MAYERVRSGTKTSKELAGSGGSRSRLKAIPLSPFTWLALGALIAISLGQSSCPQTPTAYQPLVPTSTAPGGGAFTLTVNGDQFTSGSTIDWNGTPLPAPSGFTATSTQLEGTVPASLIASPGTAAITVASGSGGGSSNVIYFPVWKSAASATFVSAAGSPITAGNVPESIAVGDFNGDGKPDLAIANTNAGTVTILLGNGDGTFTQAPGSPIAVGNGPDALTVADFNVDGVLDLAVANGKDGTVTILLGKGNGTFAAASGSPVKVGTDPDAIVAGDFAAAGHPSLAVANGGSNNLTILLGNGDGTFTAASTSPVAVGTAPDALAVGDFNGDGNLDLAVANSGDNTATVLLGDGKGDFTVSGSPITVGKGPTAIVEADFNNDGKQDLAVANGGDGTVSILLGNGDGTFTPAPSSPITVGSGPSALAVAEFNGDNKLDLAVSNNGDNTVTLLLGKGDGTFAPTASPTTTGKGPSSLAVADFNGDGRLDLATANTTDSTVSVLLQPVSVALSATSLTFAEQGRETTSAVQTVTITNNTSSAVNFTAISLTGANTNDFNASAAGTTCSTSTALAAGGGSCVINVTFTPVDIGSLSATLNITTSSGVTPSLSLALSGTGFAGGELSIAPSSLSFGLQPVGKAASPQTVTVTNVSSVYPVSFSAIATTVPDYAIVPPASGATACQSLVGSTLATGASCVIPVTFTPSVAGPIAGALTLTDNAALSPQSVTLKGSGTYVVLSTSTVNFGSVVVDGTSGVESVTLMNVGSSPLTISGISASASFAIASSTTCSTSVPLAGGASCRIDVTLTPTQGGNIAGELSISDSDPSSPQTVALSGLGQDFTLQTFTTSQSVFSGGSANYLLKVTPEFGFNGSVSLACSGAPQNATCAVTPSSVTLDGSGYAAPTLNVQTSRLSLTAPLNIPLPPDEGRWLLAALGLLCLAGTLALRRLRHATYRQASLWRWDQLAPLAVLVLALMLWASCGMVSQGTRPANYGTPTGTYTVTVTGSVGKLTHSTTVSLTVQ